MTFEDLNLNKPLLNALSDLGYTTPTTIQEKVFSVVMSGKDVCGIAQTGTGKTYAYLLPTLRQMQYSKDRLPQLLILVPTRELVVQVVDEVKKLTKYMSLEVVGVYGGANIKRQIAELNEGADIIVGTPGRFLDLVLNGALKTKGIKRLVIDEMDEMLNLGFRTQLNNILDAIPQKRQNLLFSATIPEEVEALMDNYFNTPIRVEAAPVGTPLENIEQRLYNLPNFQTKINLLRQFLSEDKEMSKVLVFVSSKALADLVYQELENEYAENMGVIHSNKDQNYRFRSVQNFHNGTYRLLIATDIVARGIDVAGVSHVFNFDIPEIPENYIHRIGRTGRADRKGIAITFVTDKDQEVLERIQALMNYEVPVFENPDDLVISEVQMEFEKPQIVMKGVGMKIKIEESAGPAFHQKKAKNSKVNVRKDHKKDMQKKYGKPIKKSGHKPGVGGRKKK